MAVRYAVGNQWKYGGPEAMCGGDSGLRRLLRRYRENASCKREQGDSFEELALCYLKNEPKYGDLFGGNVWKYADWWRRQDPISMEQMGLSPADIGIDAVGEVENNRGERVGVKLQG